MCYICFVGVVQALQASMQTSEDMQQVDYTPVGQSDQ